jgi:uncharacterized protein YdeI (YjbR/CyaY-like superfamily)
LHEEFMGTKDPRIDAYIAKSADFAKPILTHLREVVHAACPEVEETMKWSSPHFDYKGEMMCGMAAFKEHCRFGFWKGSLIPGVPSMSDLAAGPMGRITSVKDLPSKAVLTGYIKQAMKLNDAGVKLVMKGPPKKPLPTPPDLARALKSNKAARATFDGFSPSARRDYVEWLLEAKTEETRARRLETATGWIAEGKARNWKYQK